MKQLLKFVAALCVALAIVLGVRAVAFTICTVPVDIGDKLHRGDKVMVNKLSSALDFSRGDIIVYDEQGCRRASASIAVVRPSVRWWPFLAIPFTWAANATASLIFAATAVAATIVGSISSIPATAVALCTSIRLWARAIVYCNAVFS